MKQLVACKTCINSGFLCTSCQTKLDEGHLTDFELDLAKELLHLEDDIPEKYGFLKDVSFTKAIDFEDVVILEVGKKDKIRITSELLKDLKKTYEIDTIILIEKTDKPRAVVDSLIAPYKLVSLNEIFLATGEIEFKAVLRESDKENILFTPEELEDLILELSGQVTRIEFQ